MTGLLSAEVLARALADLEITSKLKHPQEQLGLVKRLAPSMRLMLRDQNRIAELRIRTARRIGSLLLASTRRSGCLVSLPGSISPKQASVWQTLAKIPPEALERYLGLAAAREEEVTVAGFLRASKAPSLEAHFSSERGEWLTPKETIDATIEILGQIDLDPCSNRARNVPAGRHYMEDDDGLGKPWAGRVYMNPPYGRHIKAWVKKLVEDFEEGFIKEAIALLPARTDTLWFEALRSYPRVFVKGRLTFSGHEHPAPFPSVIVYLGARVERFLRVFARFGDSYFLAPVAA